MRSFASSRCSRERGATLLIGMLILMLVTLVSMSVIRLATQHTQIVANEQLRTEAEAAASYGLDLVLNKPLTAWSGYTGDIGQLEYVNLGLTQSADAIDSSIAVQVSNLRCVRGRPLMNHELMRIDAATGVVQVADEADKPCIFSGVNRPLVFSSIASSGSSMCATVLWELRAQSNDPRLLSASTTITQGVEVRVDIGAYADACK